MKKILLTAALFAIQTTTQGQMYWHPEDHHDLTPVLRMKKGKISIPKALCGQVPRSEEVQETVAYSYEWGSVLVQNFAYPDGLLLTLVYGPIRYGRSETEAYQHEINTIRKNQAGLLATKLKFKADFTEIKDSVWPTVGLRVNNTVSNTPEVSPFPINKIVDLNPDTPLASMSIHRVFFKDTSKFEIAALQDARHDITESTEAEMFERLNSLVEEFTKSLQECTQKMRSNNN